jgi:hypothetical protein
MGRFWPAAAAIAAGGGGGRRRRRCLWFRWCWVSTVVIVKQPWVTALSANEIFGPLVALCSLSHCLFLLY